MLLEPWPSGGGKEVWRRGCEEDVALAMEGLRRGLGAPVGRARGGPARGRGRAREEGAGGEWAEGGGEAIVVVVWAVRDKARLCGWCMNGLVGVAD